MYVKFIAILSYLLVIGIGALFYLLMAFLLENLVEDEAKNNAVLKHEYAHLKSAAEAKQPLEEFIASNPIEVAIDPPKAKEQGAKTSPPNSGESSHESGSESKPKSNPGANLAANPSEPKIQNKPEKAQIYSVKTGILNVRELPSTEAKIIRKYAQGDNILIAASKDNWGALKDGGFVSMDFIEKNPDENAKIASSFGVKIYVVQSRILNVRESPDRAARVLQKLAQNESVVIAEINGEWGRLMDGGWVSMGLVAEKN